MAPCSSFSSCFQSRRPVPRPPWPLRWIYVPKTVGHVLIQKESRSRPGHASKKIQGLRVFLSSPGKPGPLARNGSAPFSTLKKGPRLWNLWKTKQRHRSEISKCFNFLRANNHLAPLLQPEDDAGNQTHLSLEGWTWQGTNKKTETGPETKKITEAKSSLSPTSWREYDSPRTRTIFAGSNLKVQIRQVASSNCCTACRGENELHPPKETHPSIQQFHSFKEMIWTKHEHMVIHLIWRNATHQKCPEVFVMSCPRLQKEIPLMISIVWEPPFTTVGLEEPLEKLHGCREPGGTQLRAPITSLHFGDVMFIHSIQREGK